MIRHRRTLDWTTQEAYDKLINIIQMDIDEKREKRIQDKIKEGDEAHFNKQSGST